ncbi:helix-turn-helix domain-containing protein [Changpingibacter yushuensis]|uniref:helix-turn-helix domain-containing protein n=1 Tax=Changpingibacter yushuensis TaxID=2758440 RepID=UPI00165E18F8|nr:helix-turn-helix domain-containing protein [Changpingibacter yushuensis]
MTLHQTLERVIRLATTMPDPWAVILGVRGGDPTRFGHGGPTDGLPFRLDLTTDFWDTEPGDVRGIRTKTGVDDWATIWAWSWWEWADDGSSRPTGNGLLWLHTHLDWAISHYPSLGEFEEELAYVLRALEHVHGLDPVQTDRTCPGCGGQLQHQVTEEGLTDTYDCPGCGSQYTTEGLELMSISAALTAHELVSQNQAAELLGISRFTISSWIRRGQLEAHGTGKRIYLDEARELAA